MTLQSSRLVARPRGSLDEAGLAALRTALERIDGSLGPAVTCLIDLREVGRFELTAGKLLLEIHRAFFGRRRRTAYLADRAHLRGLTNWVVHESGDPNARTVMSDSEAQSWLVGSQERISDAKQRTQAALSAIAALKDARRKA